MLSVYSAFIPAGFCKLPMGFFHQPLAANKNYLPQFQAATTSIMAAKMIKKLIYHARDARLARLAEAMTKRAGKAGKPSRG